MLTNTNYYRRITYIFFLCILRFILSFIAKDFCKSNLRAALGLSLVHFVFFILSVVVVVVILVSALEYA